jgi:hypothetical protein
MLEVFGKKNFLELVQRSRADADPELVLEPA